MDKKDLIRAIAQESGVTISTASKALDAAIEAATHALISGEAITLKGFGTLKTSRKSARAARGFAKASPERTAITFKASAALEDKLNAKS